MRRKPKFTDHAVRFMRCWRNVHKRGGSLKDVAKEMGANIERVSVLASVLRDRGEPLPRFKTGPKTRLKK